MNIKVFLHIMPWDIDHALLVFEKFKKSSYFLEKEDNIKFDTFLNLSDSIVDWEKATLPKQYFINKYNILHDLIKDNFIHTPFIYEGNDVYGHLDSQKTIKEDNIDYYIILCPDINFQEHLLYYLIESAKQIKDDYFVLTPEIFKSWDSSWDLLVNEKFKHVEYSKCIDVDIHEIRHACLDLDNPSVSVLNNFKFAGWFDLYSKKFYEDLVPVLDEWKGYGPWDLYSMNVCNIAKHNNVNVNQYVLKNQVIWFEDTGCLKNDFEYGGHGKLRLLYKKFLPVKLGRQEQRSYIDRDLNKYLAQWVEYAKSKNIIK